MSDGMTDRRSQREYGHEYVTRATFEKIVEKVGHSLMTDIIGDPDLMAETPLTVTELRALGAKAREAAARAIAGSLTVR